MAGPLMGRLFLGVDGGQTGTRALIADETGRVIGSGEGGPASPADGECGRARFTAALEASVSAACKAAGIATGTEFAAACMGFSGGAAGKEALARELVAAQQYFVTHDAWIALNGATGGGPGIVTIAGTGSIAFGKNAQGQTARAGGWGFAFGDEGSAFDLTRQAVRAALRQEEGWGPPTMLREALLGAFPEAFPKAGGARDMNDLLHRFYTPEFPRARVAALAEVVDATASRGDAIAQEILRGAAQALATLAGAVRQKLFGEAGATPASQPGLNATQPGLDAERGRNASGLNAQPELNEFGEAGPVDVRYSGGVFRCRTILARFQMLMELDGRTAVSAPAFDPAAGALMEAFRIAGVECRLEERGG